MKLIATLILFALSIFATESKGQELYIDSITQKYIMRQVITVDSVTSSKELYDKCKTWLLKNIKSADVNNQLDDPAFKSLISTGAVSTSSIIPYSFSCYMFNCSADFKIQLEVKDKKVRCTLSNIIHNYTIDCSRTRTKENRPLEVYDVTSKPAKKIFIDLNLKLQALIADLNASLLQKDDW